MKLSMSFPTFQNTVSVTPISSQSTQNKVNPETNSTKQVTASNKTSSPVIINIGKITYSENENSSAENRMNYAKKEASTLVHQAFRTELSYLDQEKSLQEENKKLQKNNLQMKQEIAEDSQLGAYYVEDLKSNREKIVENKKNLYALDIINSQVDFVSDAKKTAEQLTQAISKEFITESITTSIDAVSKKLEEAAKNNEKSTNQTNDLTNAHSPSLTEKAESSTPKLSQDNLSTTTVQITPDSFENAISEQQTQIQAELNRIMLEHNILPDDLKGLVVDSTL